MGRCRGLRPRRTGWSSWMKGRCSLRIVIRIILDKSSICGAFFISCALHPRAMLKFRTSVNTDVWYLFYGGFHTWCSKLCITLCSNFEYGVLRQRAVTKASPQALVFVRAMTASAFPRLMFAREPTRTERHFWVTQVWRSRYLLMKDQLS